MKKILSVILTLCLFATVSFSAFDPYADEEVEKKSYKKLYYGIVLTLLGGFLAYDGFSTEEVDVSKPSVDYITVSHSEFVQRAGSEEEPIYEMRSGLSLNNVVGQRGDYTKYEIKDDKLYDQVEPNILYNNGNVDLKNITIEVRYRYKDGTYIGTNGEHVTQGGYNVETGERVENQGYHIAQVKNDVVVGIDSEGHNIIIDPEDPRIKAYTYETVTELKELKKGESVTWQDVWGYTTKITDSPNGNPRSPYLNEEDQGTTYYNDGTTGLNLGKDSPMLMDVRVKLNKYKQYKPIYETRHKSDLEGVAGLLIGITGIYFIVDHFLDMHKFNAYAKRHNLNFKVTTASNEYKLMLQKRI